MKYSFICHISLVTFNSYKRVDSMLTKHMAVYAYENKQDWNKYDSDSECLKGLLYTMIAMKVL